jgi:predicted nucleic acid-binding protein
MIYVDTSILVAAYCPEPLSKAAQREIRKTRAPTISPFSEVEFCSAVALKTRTGEMDAESARKVLVTFRLHLTEGVFRMVPVEAREHAIACEWICSFAAPLRTVDALHLAAAFANDLTLITADKVLAHSAKQFGVKHKLIA